MGPPLVAVKHGFSVSLLGEEAGTPFLVFLNVGCFLFLLKI